MSEEFKETPSAESPKETSADGETIQNVSAIQGLSPEAQQSMKSAHQSGDFSHDIEDSRNNPEIIKNFSRETRDKYFGPRMQKVEADANSHAKPALDELKQKYADQPEIFDALDQAYPNQDFKKLEYFESCGAVPTLETNDQLCAVYKYHDGNSKSQFYTPEYMVDLKTRQDRLALPTKGTFGDQYLLEPGARYLKSPVAPKFDRPGGGEQWLVIDKHKVVRPGR